MISRGVLNISKCTHKESFRNFKHNSYSSNLTLKTKGRRNTHTSSHFSRYDLVYRALLTNPPLVVSFSYPMPINWLNIPIIPPACGFGCPTNRWPISFM